MVRRFWRLRRLGWQLNIVDLADKPELERDITCVEKQLSDDSRRVSYVNHSIAMPNTNTSCGVLSCFLCMWRGHIARGSVHNPRETKYLIGPLEYQLLPILQSNCCQPITLLI